MIVLKVGVRLCHSVGGIRFLQVPLELISAEEMPRM